MKKFHSFSGEFYLYAFSPVWAAKQVIEIIRHLAMSKEAVNLLKHKIDQNFAA